MISQTWWYLARASGVVAWLLLTASILWGIVLSTKAFPKRRRPAWLLDLHRWLGGLTVAFVVFHVLAILADSYTPIQVVDVVVPFTSPWRPFAVGLGVIAGWALVAVQATSLAMRHLPRRVWHGIHFASYATFVLGTGHAFLAGSDRNVLLYQVTGAAGMVAVVWATIYRVRHPRATRPRPAERAPVTDIPVPATGAATSPAWGLDVVMPVASSAPIAPPAPASPWSVVPEGPPDHR